MAFIVFEGIDGSGKTSMIRKLGEELTRRKTSFVMTREPGGSLLGEELRKVLLRTEGEIPVPICELLLYEAIRAQHVSLVIKPNLAEGRWILCDRFTSSTMAFQAAGRSLNIDDIVWLNKFATQGVKPDLTILLDVPIEIGLTRQKKRIQSTGQVADRFEQEENSFHSKVRTSYLEQSKQDPESWLVIDATQPLELVAGEMFEALRKRQWLGS